MRNIALCSPFQSGFNVTPAAFAVINIGKNITIALEDPRILISLLDGPL